MSATSSEEKIAATYGLIWTYFHAKKWDELKRLYFSDAFVSFDTNSVLYPSALVMFYRAFSELQSPFVIQEIKQNPAISHLQEKIELFEKTEKNIFDHKMFKDSLKTYEKYKKSPFISGLLNASLFGSGYLYLGQMQSALTAFLLLSLLALSLRACVKQKNWGLCFLIFSVFTGFYWGSIVGAEEAASYYNQTLHTFVFDPVFQKEGLYPELMITHAP